MANLLTIDPSTVRNEAMDYEEFVIKKKNGKTRKIVNPSPGLKRYQRSRLGKLHRAFRKLAGNLDACFHGFVPRRNSVTAATFHVPFEATTMYDFSNFFDTVTLNHIEKAGLALDTNDVECLFHLDGYAAQGFPSSPMLANIALIPFMRELEAGLTTKFGPDGYVLTVYADDIQISANIEGKLEWGKVSELVIQVAESHNFIINPDKTRTRYAKYGARRILGVNVTPTGIEPTRKTNRKVRALRQQTDTGQPKGQVLGGMRTWQKCYYPKNVDYVL